MFIEGQEILDKRYRVVKKLGGGAFGEIYKGKSYSLSTTHATKGGSSVRLRQPVQTYLSPLRYDLYRRSGSSLN